MKRRRELGFVGAVADTGGTIRRFYSIKNAADIGGAECSDLRITFMPGCGADGPGCDRMCRMVVVVEAVQRQPVSTYRPSSS